MSISLQCSTFPSPKLSEATFSASDGRNRRSIKTLSLPHNQKSGWFVKIESMNADAVHKIQSQYDRQQLVELLHHCAENGSHSAAKSVHGFVLRIYSQEEDNLIILLNHVAYAYSMCSDFKIACRVFDNMLERNTFSWNVMISGSAKNGLFVDGWDFFHEMHSLGVPPDKFTYSAVIKVCIGLGSIELGKVLHSQIIRAGFSPNTFISTSLLSMYAKLGEMGDSCKVFNSMEEQNDVSWNAMISGFTSNGLYSEAYDYFLRMKVRGLKPNVYTLISALKAVGKLGDINKGRDVHNYVSETGNDSNVSVGTALIDMYAKCGSISSAKDVFYLYFQESGVNAPWNAMISAYSYCGLHREALDLFVMMCHKSVKSDIFTYCTVFNSIATSKNLRLVRAVHGMVLKSESNLMVTDVSNAMSDAYAKCKSLKDVEKVFKFSEDKDLISWTTILTACTQCSDEVRALSFFSRMREEGFLPNEYAYSSLLTACSSLCFFDFGRQIHGLVYKARMDCERCIESALIDLYAKCGSITDAGRIFERIHMPDVVSWTCIISGYALHGLIEKAIKLFKEMEQRGTRPNSVTFLSILFACSHGGLVEEGMFYFHRMQEIYDIIPDMEHYACIVDLLGRVGHLDNALDFIKKMPIEPNEMIWQSLLGACRVHGNIKLGKLAADMIVSVKPQDAATFVLLSNTYMQRGKLEDALGVRDMMKDMGMKKEPGFSWISVNGEIHRFYSRDQEHPQRFEIYAILEELRIIMTFVNQGPNLSHALKDLELV
ncbi:hypothetical protein SAY86_019038 [Trapa natans]|uniref:Pentatricopeptide repeat-containing protein n=1 Tax=Trapa natans TaxID=22666 RepID=A0AAN7R1I3_TRANT|nr:hypothetical protein SAY86_019038 [Trapa natans]